MSKIAMLTGLVLFVAAGAAVAGTIDEGPVDTLVRIIPEPVIPAVAAPALPGARRAPAAVAAPVVPDGAASTTITLTGRLVYHHPVTGEYQPCSLYDGVVAVYVAPDPIWGGSTYQAVASFQTDNDGRFTVQYTDTGNNIYALRLKSVNQAARGMIFTGGLSPGWDTFWLGTYPIDSGGSSGTVDLGTLCSSNEDLDRALHALTNILRNQMVMWYLTGDVVPQVDAEIDLYYEVEAPEFVDATTLLIGSVDEVSDGALAAKYARLWMANYCPTWLGDCADGVACETWCGSGPQAAYTEGLAAWFGDIVPRRYPAFYPYEAAAPYDFDDLQRCGCCWSSVPDSTVGFFAAVLRDIQDTTNDQHTDYGSVWRDALSLGHDEIVAAARFSAHSDPLHFLRWLRDAHTDIRPQLWKTAMNCGYQIDDEPPGVITGVTSSHTVGVPSADATITIGWTPAVDLDSGVAGYSIRVGSRVLEPDTVADAGAVTTWTSQPLLPGSWYIMVRAVDVAGNWATSYATLGPYTVADAGPSDLQPYAPAGWARPVVPRPTGDASSVSCPAPELLVGGGWTYFNAYGLNAGGATEADVGIQFAVDGRLRGNPYGVGPVGALQQYWILNRANHVVAGRHTLEAVQDGYEVIAETDETNNAWAWQWVWSPATLAAGTVQNDNPPPDPAGGRDEVPSAATTYDNCNGYRLAASGTWRAVFLQPDDLEDDYELDLYALSTGPTDGFATPLRTSRRGAGAVSALLMSNASSGYDFGVINRGRIEGQQDYTISVVAPLALTLGDTLVAPQAEGEQFLMRKVAYDVAEHPWLTVSVEVTPADGPVRWFWCNDWFTGALESSQQTGVTDAGGRSVATFELDEPFGTGALVVVRDPVEWTAPDTLTVSVGYGLPDFEPYSQPGWDGPVVPRPAADGTAQAVAYPDTLYGNVTSTYFNLCLRNASVAEWDGNGDTLTGDVVVDGATDLGGIAAGYLAGDTALPLNMTTPRTVRGGRHTAALVVDGPGTVTEMDETNNAYGEQFCWSPLELAYGVPTTRAAPPDPYGGWETLPADSTRWYNCDGVRLAVPTGRFGAVAVMPAVGSDVDERLHEPLRGVRDGFREQLAVSEWGPGASDYVLVDFGAAPVHAYDVGLVKVAGETDCTVEAVSSAPLGGGTGTYGPFTLPAGRLLDLHEVQLDAGIWSVRLTNVAGAVDWGLALHAGGVPFQTKTAAFDSAQAYFEGPGGDEVLVLNVPTAGTFAVAVWKVGGEDLSVEGTYELVLQNATTAVPGDGAAVPQVSGLADVRPNPFNPRTTLVLDMARGGRAELTIFDMRGRRVRALVAGELAAGRHEVVWDGRDDRGEAVATGAYLARLRTADVPTQVRKLMLVR